MKWVINILIGNNFEKYQIMGKLFLFLFENPLISEEELWRLNIQQSA